MANRKINPQNLQKYIKEHPDAYLKELSQQFNVKPSSMYNALVKLKLTRKKAFMYSEKSETNRQVFLTLLSKIPEANCAYVDECGIKKDLVREYGYAFRGMRVEAIRRGRKFRRVNVIGGLFDGEIVALLCFEHSCRGVFFLRIGLKTRFCLVCQMG